jgi:hypothetical protein
MISFKDRRWEKLLGGYRTAFDPRPALQNLESDVHVKDAWHELWEELHHQGDVGEASPDCEFLELADYVLTTFYHADFVKKFASELDKRVIALSLSLNKEALYEIVSLELNLRVGAILSPTDPPPRL